MNAKDIHNLSKAYMEVYEEVDTRRAPKELLDRLNSSREGHMAQDGPNRPAYEARQRLLQKAHKRRKVNEEFKDLTPEKEEKVIRRREELLNKLQHHSHEARKNATEFTKRKEGRGIRAKIKHLVVGNAGPARRAQEHAKKGKTYAQHIRNIGDALSRTQASKDAAYHYKRNQLRQQIRDLGGDPDLPDAKSNIRRFKRESQNEAYQFLISYLLDEGYANNIKSAENIAEHMSESWINNILYELTEPTVNNSPIVPVINKPNQNLKNKFPTRRIGGGTR